MLADGLLAGALTAVDLGWLVAQRAAQTVEIHAPGGLQARHVALFVPAAAGLVALQSVPLVARRRAPVPVIFAVGLARVAYDVAGFHDAPQPLGVLVALYTVASLVEGRWRPIVAATTAVGLAVSMATNPPDQVAVQLALTTLLLSGAWVLGDNARTRRAYVEEVEAHAVESEQARAAARSHAAFEERARIARELHDVVAHHLSVIAVQSEAAAALLPADPARAGVAVSAVSATARQALAEMRDLLGVLRRAPGAELAPAARLDDLAPLLDRVRAAGLAVRLEVVGTPRSLPTPVELGGYRVVQEALTNVLRHAGAERVDLRVDWRSDGVGVVVSNDGPRPAPHRGPAHHTGPVSSDGPLPSAEPGQTGGAGQTGGPAGAPGDGHGLAGMRERVDALGGRLEVGARPGGGFRVDAWFPTSTP